MSESLRILTYNTQLRSWGMEVGADGSIPPSTTAEERAGLIAEKLNAGARDYDVVCLQEVFDEDARAILVEQLCITGRYPFAITKADVGGLEIAWPGKPILPFNPVALALSVSGLGFLASWAAYGTPKLEDSGLMLFSRWPFALQPPLPSILELLDPRTLSELVPPFGLPQVGYMVYADSAGDDAWAAKGVIYARIQRNSSRRYHVFASHTQADSKVVGEHAGSRAKQLQAVGKFMQSCAGPVPFGEEVFFVGDLNIVGGQRNVPQDQTGEWHQRFVRPGELLADHLVEVWGREQCQGSPGLRDRGTTADTVYPPQEQRLDYLFRSASGQLAVQHLFVDYDLSTVPPGHNGVSFLSDHRPLGADINARVAHCTPDTALGASAGVADFHDRDGRGPGGVKWYRFDEDGTYEFRLDSSLPVDFEVYLDTDLSRPRQQYREESRPDFGPRFVLPSAPFLVKVFCVDRAMEFTFDFRAHRHVGASIEEAVDLVPEQARHDTFPQGQLLNTDQPRAPWGDLDSKWFRLDTPRTEVDGTIELSVDVTLVDHVGSGAVLVVGREESNGDLSQVARDSSTASLSVAWPATSGDRFFVAIQRRDTAGAPLSFDVVAHTNITILLGGTEGDPRLVCTKETSGWGSDDISLELGVDSHLLHSISNDKIGDFDDGDPRPLAQWLSTPIAYLDHVTVTVTEEDDIDSDDVGSRTIPGLAALAGAPGIRIDGIDPVNTQVAAIVNVDDGTYELRASLARWNEKA